MLVLLRGFVNGQLVNPMCKYYFYALMHPEPAVAPMGYPLPFLRRETTQPEQTCQGLEDLPPAWKNLHMGLVRGEASEQVCRHPVGDAPMDQTASPAA